ncbi:MAG: DHH family phosphoesterase [Candidatus Micrarchaeota archaeon]|nr:DHH family phosphoesterase [Candidatus Micrarchaeota archaeon]
MFEGKFEERCKEALALAKRMRHPIVINHYDCDGLCAGGIITGSLRKLGIRARNRTVRKLGEEEIRLLAKENEKEIIFADFGGAMGEAIESELADSSVLIIDHHQAKDGKILQVNPHLFGMSGDFEMSAAGAAYSVFRDDDFAHLAIVGAIGDMQEPLTGANRKILEHAEKTGAVKSGTELRFFGRNSRPLAQFLSYASEPYLPGLTGDTDACHAFLKGIGIEEKKGEKWRSYSDLSKEEKRILVDGLVDHLFAHSSRIPLDELIGEVFDLPRQPVGTPLSDAKEFSTLLNACGRQGKPEIGIAVCIGEEGAQEESQALLRKHRQALREGIAYAENSTEDFGEFYFLDARGVIDDGIVGVVAGMLYGVIRRDKPILAFALYEKGEIKISSRATKKLVRDGINLGATLAEACAGIGVGGGHSIAAGAQVKEDKINEFLLAFGEGVGKSKSEPA